MNEKYSQNKVLIGASLAVLATLIWSGNFIIARSAKNDIPPITLAFFRWLSATLILLPFTGHLFIKEIDGNYEVAVIDLEKSRLSFLPLLRVLTDLATLHYRTNHWTKTSRLYFYMQYYQTQKLAWLHKVICRWIDKQAMKKRNKQTS